MQLDPLHLGGGSAPLDQETRAALSAIDFSAGLSDRNSVAPPLRGPSRLNALQQPADRLSALRSTSLDHHSYLTRQPLDGAYARALRPQPAADVGLTHASLDRAGSLRLLNPDTRAGSGSFAPSLEARGGSGSFAPSRDARRYDISRPGPYEQRSRALEPSNGVRPMPFCRPGADRHLAPHYEDLTRRSSLQGLDVGTRNIGQTIQSAQSFPSRDFPGLSSSHRTISSSISGTAMLSASSDILQQTAELRQQLLRREQQQLSQPRWPETQSSLGTTRLQTATPIRRLTSLEPTRGFLGSFGSSGTSDLLMPETDSLGRRTSTNLLSRGASWTAGQLVDRELLQMQKSQDLSRLDFPAATQAPLSQPLAAFDAPRLLPSASHNAFSHWDPVPHKDTANQVPHDCSHTSSTHAPHVLAEASDTAHCIDLPLFDLPELSLSPQPLIDRSGFPTPPPLCMLGPAVLENFPSAAAASVNEDANDSGDVAQSSLSLPGLDSIDKLMGSYTTGLDFSGGPLSGDPEPREADLQSTGRDLSSSQQEQLAEVLCSAAGLVAAGEATGSKPSSKEAALEERSDEARQDCMTLSDVIVVALAATEKGRSGTADLASILRTCKSWQDAASTVEGKRQDVCPTPSWPGVLLAQGLGSGEQSAGHAQCLTLLRTSGVVEEVLNADEGALWRIAGADQDAGDALDAVTRSVGECLSCRELNEQMQAALGELEWPVQAYQ